MLELKVEDGILFLKGIANYESLPYFIRNFNNLDSNIEIIDITGLDKIDTLFFSYLVDLGKKLKLTSVQERLLRVIEDNWSADGKKKKAVEPHVLEKIGRVVVGRIEEFYMFLVFVGMVFVNTLKILSNPKRIRVKAILSDIEAMGFKAVPILFTISFLIGAVIAYHSSAKLEQFGANIFIVDLVGMSMLREMGPMLVAILMAGRSSSSYTAQIGIMKVTEEIDVIKTMGVDPFDVLVFPKLVSMFIAFPLLTVLSDVAGVAGGAMVARFGLHVTFSEFILRFHQAISLNTFLVGMIKAPVFAFLIASIGSFKGFRTQKNVESIGKNVTISVVDSLFAVIIADAIFSVMFRIAGI